MNLKKKLKAFVPLARNGNGGFTLVELIVVIAIIAILGGVAVPAYSGYVEKANKTADISLASDIEQALLLAHYSNKLAPGTSVVVFYDDTAVSVNEAVVDGYSATSGADALTATFGSGYTDLRLKYEGWDEEIGVAGDAGTMQVVKASNFTPDALDSLLGQVQLVVDEASLYLSKGGVKINEAAAAILNSNGIAINAGDTLNSTTGMAAANAYVYLVGNELASMNLESEDETEITKNNAFIEAWSAFDFSKVEGFDGATTAAAEYASIYALATYIDKSTAGTANATDYTTRMNAAGDPRNVAEDVLNEISSSTDSSVVSAFNAYKEDESLKDMGAFLAYMKGLTSSADSLMKNTDLTKGQYFTDGYVADYVNNYIELSDVLTANGNSGSSFAFIYTGTDVLCMPLDW